MTGFLTRRTQKPRTKWTLYLTLISVSFMQQVQADCASHPTVEQTDIVMEWEGQCYIFIQSLPVCEDIFNACEYRGGVAAKLDSLEQQRHFYQEIVETLYVDRAYIWIGMKYDRNIDDWKWANGDPVTWTNWKTRPNKNNCLAVVDLEGTWVEYDASKYAAGYICQIRQTTTTSPSTNGTTTAAAVTTALATTEISATTTSDRETTTEPTPESTTQPEKW